MFSYGLLHMNTQELAEQQKRISQQLSTDTGCHLEDLHIIIAERDRWGERERERESKKSVPSERFVYDHYGHDHIQLEGCIMHYNLALEAIFIVTNNGVQARTRTSFNTKN